MSGGGYEFVRELGRGAMGSVQLARQTALDRHVAIKRVVGAAGAGVTAGGLEAEGRLLARLNHPNVVQVYELLTEGEDVLLVMEYVPGTDLRGVLAGGAPAPATAVGYVEQLAAALDHAHERGLVHRDVKPANALVRPDGVLKLGDFGVAELRSRRRAGAGGGPIGTPAYMAPELARGHESVDRRADVYGLAVVAYELLAGRVPFPADPADIRSTLRAQIEEAPPRPGLPEPLETALLRGLEKRPEARPRSAGEFAAALRSGFERGSGDGPTLSAAVPLDDGTLLPPAATLAGPPAPDQTLPPRGDVGEPVTGAPHPPSRPSGPVRSERPRAAAPTWRPGRGSALLLVGLLAAAAVVLASIAVARARPASAPAPAPGSLQVSAVAATVSPQTTGHCPEATFTFRGTVATGGGAGTIAYSWLQPDGTVSAAQTISLAAGARQATVTLQFKFSGSGSTHGTAALHVTRPIDVYSTPIDVTYACP